MARQFNSGKVLTYRADRGWVRVINGTRVRFGPVRPRKSDRNAYRQAVKEYLAYVEEMDRLSGLRAEAKARGLADEHFIDLYQRQVTGFAFEQPTSPFSGVLPQVKQQQVKKPKAAPVAKSLTDLLDAYLAEQHKRFEVTKAAPDALPPKKRLSWNGWRGIKDAVEGFRRWLESRSDPQTLGNSEQFERVLSDYRAYLDGELIAARYSASTVSNRARHLRPFLKWLWQTRQTADLPRNLEQVCGIYRVEPQPKPLTPEQIHALWEAADEEWRARIAMGLNCALYSQELAAIKVGDIRKGYYAGYRPKTGVAGRFKLWPVTRKLLAAKIKGRKPDEPLFVGDNGKPIASESKDVNSREFAAVRDRAGLKDVVWNQLRDTAATEIRRIGTREGHSSLASDLLRHKDGHTARFYVGSTDPHAIRNQPLDDALDEFGAALKLTVESARGRGRPDPQQLT